MTRTMQDTLGRMQAVEQIAQERGFRCGNILPNSVHPSTVSALKRRGLVEKVTCPIDRVTKELRLTDAGRAAGGA